MRQWFSGRFAGHYQGTPQKPTGLSRYPGFEHFRIEVYEALVSEIELGERLPDPEPARGDMDEPASTDEPPSTVAQKPGRHHEPPGDSLHQSHVAQVHFIDALHLGQTVRSTAHDVLMSDLNFSHPARHGSQSFGRIEGKISGWFRPPPEPDPIEEITPRAGPAPVGWSTDVIASPGARKDESDANNTQNEATQGTVNLKKPLRKSSIPHHAQKPAAANAAHRPRPAHSPPEEAAEYPFFAAGTAISLLMGVFAAPPAVVLFAPTFLLAYALRRWLLGVVPDAAGVRFLSLVVSAGQVLLALLLVARWSAAGCVSLNPLWLVLLLAAPLLTSLLPRPLPFAITTAMFALVLFQAYASWALPLCS